MRPEDRIRELSEELQVLAFNLADVLETVNFHSGREAAAELERTASPMASDMQKLIRDLLHNLDAAGMEEPAGEAREMYALLDVTRKISVEPENYRHFLSALIPLLKLLDQWGERGAVAEDDNAGGAL